MLELVSKLLSAAIGSKACGSTLSAKRVLDVPQHASEPFPPPALPTDFSLDFATKSVSKPVLRKTHVCFVLLCIGLSASVSFGARVILNEYNTVKAEKLLKENGQDSYLGRVEGNGGSWFELVVVEDVDMRNWRFHWINNDDTDFEGNIFLSDDDAWAQMKAGTIITFIQDSAEQGGKDTDPILDYADDWWVNVCTKQEQASYNTGAPWLARVEPHADTGQFKTGAESWILFIYDQTGTLEFGPCGEGEYVANAKRKVGGSEMFYLYDDPSVSITPYSNYDNGWESSFGSANISPEEDEDFPGLKIQDFSRWWGAPRSCEQVLQMGYSLEGDLNADCQVDIDDLAIIMNHWLECNDPQDDTCDHPWKQASSLDLVLNEFNSVAPAYYLDGKLYSEAGKKEGLEADAYFASLAPDVLDGRIQGNGGNWIELVIVRDHLDLRGWQLRWAATYNVEGKADQANGTDIWYGDGAVEQGIITFNPNATELSDLRAGTILTLSEQQSIGIDTDDYGYADRNFTNVDPNRFDVWLDLSTDLSFDPFAQDPNQRDWWIHISTLQEADRGEQALVTTQTNVAGEGSGHFTVSKHHWEISILNAQAQTVFGPVGENTLGWSSEGIGDRDIGLLEADPSQAVTPSNYGDGAYSSFGRPNRWGGGEQDVQNFGQVRSPLYAPSSCEEARAMGFVLEYDLNGNCRVDADDIEQLILSNWLNCIVPGGPDCARPWLEP
jgi:hypothetical protein